MRKNFIKKLGLLLLLSAITGSGADWPTFRGNQQRTGYSSEKVGIPYNKPVWQCSLACNIVSSPSVANSLIYIGGRDSSLYAIEANSGKIRWKQKTHGWVDCSPLIHKGMVIVGSRDNRIYAFDKNTGDSISTWDAGLQLSSPGIADDTTILSGLGPPMNGFGALGWNQTAKKWIAGFDQPTYSSPAIFAGRAVIGANNGRLYGFDLVKRDTLWSLKTQGGIYLSTAAISDSVVYFAPGDYDRHIYAVDAMDGKFFWKSNGAPVYEIAKRTAGMENRIHPVQFVELLRLSPEHRAKVLQKLAKHGVGAPKVLRTAQSRADSSNDPFNFYAYGGMNTSSVAVDSQNVYVVQKELGYPKPRFSLLALDKYSGKEAWFFAELRNSEKLGYCSSPIVANGKIFLGWGEGMVYAFNSKTGERLWADTLQGNVISSPAIANGKLYIATYDGYLYAYNLLDTPAPTNFNDGTYCYPNPAKTISNIQYYLTKPGNVEVRIYDAAERLGKVFRNNRVPAGTKQKFGWDASRATNGAYFAIVDVQYDDGTKDRKILKIGILK